MTVLKNFYKSEDIFLDLFEDEYNEMVKTNLNVEFLCMDSTILLPPTGTPLDRNRVQQATTLRRGRKSEESDSILFSHKKNVPKHQQRS